MVVARMVVDLLRDATGPVYPVGPCLGVEDRGGRRLCGGDVVHVGSGAVACSGGDGGAGRIVVVSWNVHFIPL